MFLSYCLLSLHAFLFFLYGCNLSDLWIPRDVEDLLSSFPSFMVHRLDIFCFFFLSGCNLSDLWIPEAMEDLLSSFPSFMVHQIFSTEIQPYVSSYKAEQGFCY
jgi:hypothetical protein